MFRLFKTLDHVYYCLYFRRVCCDLKNGRKLAVDDSVISTLSKYFRHNKLISFI